MPVLQRFGGFVIRMYFEDHNPPHVHVVGREFEALVAIERAVILQGQIPAPHQEAALSWIRANAAMLRERWEEFQ